MNPVLAFSRVGEPCASRQQLLAVGCTGRGLSWAVRAGHLIRVRRGWYALPAITPDLERAIRVGGRLACLSAVAELGIWVPHDCATHVWLPHQASRLRDPTNRFRSLDPIKRDGCLLHWWPCVDEPTALRVGLLDALAQIIRCQPASIALAAIDSALHQRLITSAHLAVVFARVPRESQWIRSLADRRAESGLESIARLLVHEAGFSYRVQVIYRGIGRVDLLIEGRVAVELDGRTWHDPAGAQVRDYAKDAALAAAGIVVLRFSYAQVMYRPHEVLAAIRGVLATTVPA